MTTKLHELKTELSKDIFYSTKIYFPIKHIGKGVFTDATNRPQFVLNESCVDSFRKLTRYQYLDDKNKIRYNYHFTYAELGEAFTDYNWSVFEKCANHYSAVDRTKNGMMATFYNNQLIGIFKNYEFIQHDDLVNLLINKGLSNRVNYFNLQPNFLTIGLRIVDVDKETKEVDFQYNLAILNRIDGWRGIEYYVAFKMNDVEFKYEIKNGKKRHLKQVYNLVDDIKNSVELMSQYNFKKTLDETSGTSWILEIEKEFGNKTKTQKFVESLNEVLNKLKGKYSCYTLLGIITKLGMQHGSKMAGNEISEWFVNSLFKM